MKLLIASMLVSAYATGVVVAAAVAAPSAEEVLFMSQNRSAMDRMMREMAVEPSGDVDRDFVAMMVPHHQGAIDMALAMLRYGHNVQLKRLAQEIIVTQKQEIDAMRLAVGEPLWPSAPAPTQPSITSIDKPCDVSLLKVAYRFAACVPGVQP